MPWWLLLIFLTMVWFLLTIASEFQYAAQDEAAGVPEEKRRGVSMVPGIPLGPLLFLAIAKVADIWVWPWGTRIVALLHGVLAVVLLVSIARDWYRLREPRS